MMLQRAAKVLDKGGATTKEAERVMIEDVHDAIFDLVELIKTYQSKNQLSQLLTSTIFRRRQDEMGAVVDRAILGLHLGLHVQIGNDVSAVKQDVGTVKQDVSAVKDDMNLYQVMCISHDLRRRVESDVLDGSTAGDLKRQREKLQHKAFLRELGAMIRLRSPFTVNVYGAVTSLQHRLVIVMELLAGGDLRTLFSYCEQPLSEQQSRQIIGDICAGMAFLHQKEAVHGDLKSANVLLDGGRRAKIGDFGTSRCTQHTMSTGLATFTTNSSKNTQMSLAWSAPEVLHANENT
ncbi:unnamed protein product [Laminaria digitata]